MLGLLVAVLVLGFPLVNIKKLRHIYTLEMGQDSSFGLILAWRLMLPKVKAVSDPLWAPAPFHPVNHILASATYSWPLRVTWRDISRKTYIFSFLTVDIGLLKMIFPS